MDELLAECLGAPVANRRAVLEGLCERHPEHADALGRRHAILVEAGLVDGPPGLGAAIPDRIGGYTILRLLGQGGMGVVYLAEQESVGRQVALKVVQTGAAARPRARERFRRELQAAALLDHPNICAVHDAGEVEGIPYLAMRHVVGETLAERIARTRAAGNAPTTPAAIDSLLELGERLARALHFAHERGLVHRDVKPGNVMIEAASGQPLLLDFGLAHLDDAEAPVLTRSGDRIGTPAYMSPEQVGGRAVDRRTDVYALGATLYEALTGRVPHEAPTLEALYRRILTADVSRLSRHNPHAPRELEIVLATALERDPDRRYHTASAFADDLHNVRTRRPICARSPGPWLRMRRACQRNPHAAALLAALSAGLVLVGYLLSDRNLVLRQLSTALATVDATALRASDPSAVLRTAYDAVRLEPRPAAHAIAAVHVALHGCHVDVEVPILAEHEHAFDIAPDGSLVVWGDRNRNIWCWRHGAVRPDVIGRLDSKGLAQVVALSPDLRQLAVSADGRITVFDLATDGKFGLPWSWPLGRSERILAVAWHPIQNLLAVGTGDWNLPDPQALVHLLDLDARASSRWSVPVNICPWHLAFADPDTLVVAGSAPMQSLLSVAKQSVFAFRLDGSLRGSHAVHNRPCTALAISGTLVATAGSDGRLVLWDCDARVNPVVYEHPGPVYSVDFSADGQSVVTACHDGMVRMFDRGGRRRTPPWVAHRSMPLLSASFDPTGDRLLVRLRGRRFLTTRDGRSLCEIPVQDSDERNERFLPDGRIVTFDHNAIRIWRHDDGLPVHSLPAGCMPVLPGDGSRMLSLGTDGVAQLRDWSGTSIWSARIALLGTSSISGSVCVGDEGRAFSATDEGRLAIVSPQGEPEHAVGRNGPTGTAEEETWGGVIGYLSPAPGGRMVAGSSAGQNLRVVCRDEQGCWRTRAQVVLEPGWGRDLVVRTPFAWVKEDDGTWRIVAGTSSGVLQFRFVAGNLVRLEEVLLPQARIDQLALSPDQRILAVDLGRGGMRTFVRYGAAWRERAHLPFTRQIVHLAFARDDRLLATSADMVRILDFDGSLVGLLPNIDPVGLVSAHRLPADRVLTIAANQIMREWWLDGDRALEHARRLLRR
ncbi:MAG TPA: serine/threonine-protein kinase [Planctomycetota bacterium]